MCSSNLVLTSNCNKRDADYSEWITSGIMKDQAATIDKFNDSLEVNQKKEKGWVPEGRTNTIYFLNELFN